MFNKDDFAEILTKIYKTYNNQRDFADATGVNRAYLSRYMNKKINNPPSPKILEKIANNSNGVISYAQLMEVCGYIDVSVDFDSTQIKQRTEYILNNIDYLLSIGLSSQQISKLQDIMNMDFSSNEYHQSIDNFIATLPLETAYPLLKFLQSMINDLSVKNQEQLALAQSLKKEAEELLNNAKSLKDLMRIEKKYLKKSQVYMCPVYGQISAGQPNWAEECIEGRLPIDPNLMNIVDPEECYFLRVNGESMNKVVKNGAYALIRKTDWVDDGEIAVVLVNGYDATLKKFSKQGDFVVLEPMSNDPSFQTQIYTKDTPIKIIGKYIGKFEMKN